MTYYEVWRGDLYLGIWAKWEIDMYDGAFPYRAIQINNLP